jgi:hypothetical protein
LKSSIANWRRRMLRTQPVQAGAEPQAVLAPHQHRLGEPVPKHRGAVLVGVELRPRGAQHRLDLRPDLAQERDLAVCPGQLARLLGGVRAEVAELEHVDDVPALEERGMRNGAEVEVLGLLIDHRRIEPRMLQPGMRRRGRNELERERCRQRRLGQGSWW